MKTKLDIFSGFLGAGKTMLIKKLIGERLYGENIVIIENEFGEVGIDGGILKRTNIEVKEVNAGCICCSTSGDFKDALEEVLKTYKPHRIVVEPSGVGKLSDILTLINKSDLKNQITLNMIVTLVDVTKFELYNLNFSEFYKNQITNAKTIVLSRTQNADMSQLEKVVSEIHKLNEKANIITTPWDNLDGSIIVQTAEENTKQDLLEKVNLLKKPIGINVGKLQALKESEGHTASEVFSTWGLETPKVFTELILNRVFKKLSQTSEYGTVLRAKGIVQYENNGWLQFDYVPGEFQIRETTPDYTGRICVIGNKLKKENLSKLFN